MAGTLRGIITGMIRGIVIAPGGLTHPGMARLGDSAGAGVASMQVGAVLGTAVIGAVVITAAATMVAAIGDTITIIITIIPIVIGHPDVRRQAVILQEEALQAGIIIMG